MLTAQWRKCTPLRYASYLAMVTTVASLISLSEAEAQTPATRPATFLAGADVSMLPQLELSGAVYRDDAGEPADALRVLREAGINVFRLRLFVDPSDDFNGTWGAVQDLEEVRVVAQRVQAMGAALLLDLHYSDTWADPSKQFKPAAWKDLPFDALEQRVHDYTAEVLASLANDGVIPDYVQVGNEIAGGTLWPDGGIGERGFGTSEEQWSRLARLLNAGARAVREADPDIRIVTHIHGGGRENLPIWFFNAAIEHGVDFDIAAVSHYPAFDDELVHLRANLNAVAKLGKPVLVAELAYPSAPDQDVGENPPYPMSPQGQVAFLNEVIEVVRDVPDGRGLGLIWWYPEAVPAGDRHIYRDGREGLFDSEGFPKPAMKTLGGAASGGPRAHAHESVEAAGSRR